MRTLRRVITWTCNNLISHYQPVDKLFIALVNSGDNPYISTRGRCIMYGDTTPRADIRSTPAGVDVACLESVRSQITYFLKILLSNHKLQNDVLLNYWKITKPLPQLVKQSYYSLASKHC